jgi:hypothetical protein
MEIKAYAAEAGGTRSDQTDVSTELIALRADLVGLADSVKRLVEEAPEIAKDSIEASIRRDPIRATLVAGGVGFLLSLILVR